MNQSIWFQPPQLDFMNQLCQNSLVRHLGIEVVEVGSDFLKGKMPVDQRTRQPAGALHGGASVALAETLGTWGAICTVDHSRFHCVGMEINANHLRAVYEGWVWGVARPIHQGKSTQVWGIEIRDDSEQLICISRLTVACLSKHSEYS